MGLKWWMGLPHHFPINILPFSGSTSLQDLNSAWDRTKRSQWESSRILSPAARDSKTTGLFDQTTLALGITRPNKCMHRCYGQVTVTEHLGSAAEAATGGGGQGSARELPFGY